MKRIIYLLAAFFALSFTLHKYYVSVIELNHNAESNQLEISAKVFNDDWQNALDFRLGRPVLLGSKNQFPQIDSLVLAYLTDNLSVSVNGDKKKINLLGSEIEGEATWLYMYIDSVSDVRNIELKCSILTEMFEEQRNIIQVKVGDDIKSSLFTKSKNSKQFNFD